MAHTGLRGSAEAKRPRRHPDECVTVDKLANGFKVTLTVRHPDAKRPQAVQPAHYASRDHAMLLAREWARIFGCRLIDRSEP